MQDMMNIIITIKASTITPTYNLYFHSDLTLRVIPSEVIAHTALPVVGDAFNLLHAENTCEGMKQKILTFYMSLIKTLSFIYFRTETQEGYETCQKSQKG